MNMSGIVMMLDELFIFLLIVLFAIFIMIAIIPIWLCYHICKKVNWNAIKNLYYIWWNNE